MEPTVADRRRPAGTRTAADPAAAPGLVGSRRPAGRVAPPVGHTGRVQRTFSAPTEADQRSLYEVMADLATYPAWLDVVNRAEPAGVHPPTDAHRRRAGVDDADDTDADPAWIVTLRARIGPLARSKRLRMVRTVADGHHVRFERRELDGRNHSRWVLSARVDPLDDEPWRSRVELDLEYGGSLWSGLLDGVLQAAADGATRRLQDYVSARVSPGEGESTTGR